MTRLYKVRVLVYLSQLTQTDIDITMQVVREPIQHASGKPSILPDFKPAEVTRKRGVDSQEKKPSKKKKKKKTDEIDDIFGF